MKKSWARRARGGMAALVAVVGVVGVFEATATAAGVDCTDPTGVDDEVEMEPGSTVTLDVLANDIPCEGPIFDPADPGDFYLSLTTSPAVGVAEVVDGDSGYLLIRYSAPADFIGDASFTYYFCDVADDCDSADVIVHVRRSDPTTTAADSSSTSSAETTVTAAASTAAPTSAAAGDELPRTGSTADVLAFAGLVMLSGGFALVLRASRKRAAAIR